MFATRTVFAAAVLAAFATAASAESYHVTVWNGPADCSQACLFNADQADVPVPGAAPLAEFDFTPDDANLGITWAATGGMFNTYGNFLDGGAISGYTSASGVLQSTFLSQAMSTESNAFASYFAITGLYNSATNFSTSILHDDGASLYIDNNNIFRAPGRVPGQVTSGNLSLASGSHHFGLFYVAADGGPAALNFDLPDASAAPIPEPATLALLGIGLAGLGFARRRPRA